MAVAPLFMPVSTYLDSNLYHQILTDVASNFDAMHQIEISNITNHLVQGIVYYRDNYILPSSDSVS